MRRVRGTRRTRLHMRSRMRKLQAKPGVLGTGGCTLARSGDDVDDSFGNVASASDDIIKTLTQRSLAVRLVAGGWWPYTVQYEYGR